MGKTQDMLNKEIILSDELSIHRTNLANERSLLSYIRTAATAVLVGISFVKLFEVGILQILGVAIMFGAVFTLALGLIKFKKTQEMIDREIEYIRSFTAKN